MSWSRDSRSLILSSQVGAGVYALFAMSADTGEKRQITQPIGSRGDICPALSPDGRTLAFVRFEGHVFSHLATLEMTEDLRPGRVTRLTNDRAFRQSPAWTEDGRDIVYSWAETPRMQRRLGRLRVFGLLGRLAEPESSWLNAEPNSGVAVSPRGHRLAYIRAFWESDIWAMDLFPPHEARVWPRVKLISSTRDDSLPHYSPDGKKIAFVSTRSGSSEIWICARDGTNAVPLTSFGGPMTGSPRWPPDGRYITFDSHQNGQADIFVIPSSGGTPRNLTNQPAIDAVPTWSADGKWIFFASDRSGSLEIWRMPAEGGQAIRITRQGGFRPLESTDRKHLYYADKRSDPTSLWRISTSRGEPTRIVDSLHNYSSFTVTKRGVYFIPPLSNPREAELRLIESPGRPSFRVTKIEGRPEFGLSVSPDGTTVLYAIRSPQNADLMLVENFR